MHILTLFDQQKTQHTIRQAAVPSMQFTYLPHSIKGGFRFVLSSECTAAGNEWFVGNK